MESIVLYTLAGITVLAVVLIGLTKRSAGKAQK